MSIYIKGLEMPQPGEHILSLQVYHDGTATVIGEYKYYKNQPFGVISVPGHGRLIDADALGEFPYNMDFCDGGEADEWIRNAPTIIPAEEGEG